MSLLNHEDQDVQARTNAPLLEEMFNNHPTILELTSHDPDVHAWFMQARKGRCTVEEALIGALINVQRAKEKYFNECVKLEMEAKPRGKGTIYG